MPNRRTAVVVAASFLLGACGPAAGPGASEPIAWVDSHRAEVDRLAGPLVADGWVPGLAVVLLSADGAEFYGYGVADGGGAVPGPDTRFEIASVTKVFTALLLALAVEEGDLALDDPIGPLLPDDLALAPRDGPPIRLLHLATHTSGLPTVPDDFAPADPLDPYADLGWDRLGAFLRRFVPSRDPGAAYEYSNLGAGLLGEILARRAGLSFPDLLARRILEPLGMDRSDVPADPPGDGEPLAQGHDADGRPVPLWHIPALPGAGALRSTPADLLRFLQLQLAPGDDLLGRAVALSHLPRHRASTAAEEDVALGWHLGAEGRLWHNGGTGGFHAFVAVDPNRRLAVAVLANGASFVVDDLGASLLALLLGTPRPLSLTPLARLETEQLDRCTGTYRLDPSASLTVRRDGDRLLARVTGQDEYRLWPETEERFHWRVVPVEARFDLSAPGPAAAVTLVEAGTETRAPRELPATE